MSDDNQKPAAGQFPPSRIALALLVLSGLALIVGLFNSFSGEDAAIGTKTPALESSVSDLLVKKDHILLVELSGPIFMSAGDQQSLFESDTNAVMARKALDHALEDDRVKGVLLRINSPGGTVGMSQELNAAVERVREKKPVVASLGDVAASGGYYTACAADKVVVNPGTLTASIGVIIQTLNMQELFEDKLGIQAVTIKSGQFKDLLNPYEPPSKAELQLVQNLIDESYQHFLDAVIKGRTRYLEGEEKEKRIASIKAVADGRVVHGVQAVEVGLADEVGDIDRAYEIIDQMAKERFNLRGTERLPLITLEDTYTVLDFLGLSVKIPRLHLPMAADPMTEAIPFSMRYPNQPLWIME